MRRYYIYLRSIEENNVIIEISLDRGIAQRNDSRQETKIHATSNNFILMVNKYEKMCLQIASRETFTLSLTIEER